MPDGANRIERVDWLTPHYPWPANPIPGSFHRTQALALDRAGVQVRVVAPVPFAPPPLPLLSERWRRYAAAPRRSRDRGVDVERPRYLAVPGEPAWAVPGRSIALAAGRVLARDPAPLLHAHFVVPTGLAAVRLRARLKRPYVLTVHGHDATSWPATHAERLEEYRHALRGADRVIAVSDAIGRRVRDLADVEPVTIPIGVSVRALQEAAPLRAEARAAVGLPPDRTVVLFVGRLVQLKGITAFVDALLALGRPFLGVVLGEGPLAGYRADDARTSGAVEYRGGEPPDRVTVHMAAADMLVLPSTQEGLPTVVMEAGAVGLPVIASPVDGTPELLGEDRGLYVPPSDAGAIVDAVRAVAASPAAATERAARLRGHVEREYDVDVNARRLVELYRAVVDSRARSKR
jgi:teichuronic acid biosynthesis glycosyltransferase TuaC